MNLIMEGETRIEAGDEMCSEKRWKSTENPQNVDPNWQCQKLNKDCCKVLDFFNLCIICIKVFYIDYQI